MTVASLIKSLQYLTPEAEVFISEPIGCDEQENHTYFGIRYICCDSKGEKVWFDTYGGEDIGHEMDAMIDYCIEYAISDNDYIDMVFSKEEHGYTLEDIRLNCEPSVYYWLRDNEYRKELYPFKEDEE